MPPFTDAPKVTMQGPGSRSSTQGTQSWPRAPSSTGGHISAKRSVVFSLQTSQFSSR